MGNIKIGIVEDEVIIALDIQAKLTALGYSALEPCGDYATAIDMITKDKPDLVILDIVLSGKKDGIDVAKYIRSRMNIPFIFLTANSDAATVASAKETLPNAYLLKPFNKESLFSAIEIAIHNFNNTGNVKRGPLHENSRKVKDSLFVKNGEYFQRIIFDDILYLESEHNYISVHTPKKKFIVRATMHEFIDSLDDRFIRVHRSFIVNLDKIEKLKADHIVINGMEVPISINYREDLQKQLNIQ